MGRRAMIRSRGSRGPLPAAGRMAVALPAAALVAAALTTAALGACRREAPPGPDVAARIAGEEVPYSRFEAYLARQVGDPETVLGSDVLSELFDQFLDEQLLARLAADRGLLRAGGSGPGRERHAVDALLAAGPAASPSDAEVARYYAAHAGEFSRAERVRLRQILVEDRAAAERAAAELATGADFGEVARRLSRDPSASRGGDQGVLARSDLPPAFAETIFALRPGEVSRIFPAEYGFHIFQVVERLPAEVAPLGEVAGEIRARLARERSDRRLAALVAECRNRYDVEVYGRNLPFDYEGSYSGPEKRQTPSQKPSR
jgi:peptidyl-prolyl cis-trans isomerase C